MNIYVGNLAYDVTSSDLSELFGSKGQVKSAVVIMDRDSGQSKGFGFVEMFTKKDGEIAISAFNSTDLKGKEITVNEAKPRKDNNRSNNRY